MSCRGFNDAGATPRLVEALRILAQFDPVNLGDMKTGSIWARDYNLKRIVESATDTSVFHGVYRDVESAKKVVKALKEANLGMSVVVSGLYDEVSAMSHDIGVKPHTVFASIGVWGKTKLLPERGEVLDIITMCGHGMVSRYLVTKLAKDVQTKKISSDEAARTMAKCCTCGIFNVERCKELIESLTRKQ